MTLELLRLVTVLALLALLSACGGSSTDVPAQMPDTPTVVFADPNSLTSQQATIKSLIEGAIAQSADVLPVGNLQVTVSTDVARVIPGWGLGGYTLGPDAIEIVVDPSHPNLAQILQERLPTIVAHEVHHTVRWRGPGPYNTLLEALVFEGLADRFAFELYGDPPPPWLDAFPEDQTAVYLDRALPELDFSFDFEAWFFGIDTDLPRWAGYTLGYRLVRAYLEANPGSTAGQLVQTSADEFRDAIGDGAGLLAKHRN